jgi:hypothetical protein
MARRAVRSSFSTSHNHHAYPVADNELYQASTVTPYDRAVQILLARILPARRMALDGYVHSAPNSVRRHEC